MGAAESAGGKASSGWKRATGGSGDKGAALGAVLGTMTGLGAVGGAIGAVQGHKWGGGGGNFGGFMDTIGGKNTSPGRYNIDKFDLKQSKHAGKLIHEYNKANDDRKAMLDKELAKSVQLGQVSPAQAQTIANRAQINMGQADALRGNQLGLIERLQAAEQGQGPSLAQMQLQQATDRNLAQQMAFAASSGGGAGGLRQLGQNFAMTNQQAAQQSAMTRMQEQLAARQQLGGILQGARAQDIGLATDQARLTQGANLAELQAAQQTELANLQNRQAMTLEQGKMDLANRQMRADVREKTAQRRLASRLEMLGADERFQDRKLRQHLGEEQIGMGAFQSREQAKSSLGGAGIGALGAIGAAIATSSDRTAKKNIKSGDKDLKAFLSKIKSEKYEYKNPDMPGRGHGQFVSPMAQDLEKTKLGKSMVMDTPQGKVVNYAKAAGLLLSASSMQQKRIDRLEKALLKRGKRNG